MVVEVDTGAEALVDPRATRRLIALELADVQIAPPLELDPGQSHSVFVRVVRSEGDDLAVELWEHGSAYGVRRVSGSGSSALRSRRIALVAAELVRLLGRRRQREAQLAERARQAEQSAEPAWRGVPIYVRPAISAVGVAARVGGDSWLAGPSLEVALLSDAGPRLALGAGWWVGETQGGGGLRWAELAVIPSYRVSLARSVGLDLGAVGAVSSLRLTGLELSGAAASTGDTWGARAAARVRLQVRLSDDLAIAAGPELGFALRSLQVVAGEGAESRLGGAWLGAGVALVVDPWWVGSAEGTGGAPPR